MNDPSQPFPRRRREDLDQALAIAALDAADAMVVITDTDGVIRHVNEAFTVVTGYSYDEAVGGTPRLLSSGQHDPAFYAGLWQTVLSGRTWEGELINRRKDGELYTDRMTISPVRDADGDITHLVAIKRDVSTRIDDLLAASPYGVLHLGADAGLVYANERACQLLGAGYEELLGAGWRGSLAADDQAWLTAVVALLTRGNGQGDVDEPVRVVRVGDRALRAHVGALRPGEDTTLGCVVALEDVTAEIEATAALRDRELFARTVIDTIDSPTAVVDDGGRIVHANPAWRDGPQGDPLIGLPVGTALAEWTAPTTPGSDPAADSAARIVAAVREYLLAPRDKARVIDHRSPGTRTRWWQVRISSLPVQAGGAVISATDVTAMFQAQQRSAVDAATDPLTGLRNRRGLDEGLEELRDELPLSLLFIDLDGFKPVNDTYGHATGDELLRAVAERITAQVRDQDVAARFGGDEFVVALPRTDATAADQVARRLTDRIERPVPVEADTTVSVGASIGVVTATAAGPMDELLDAADAAMYAEKQRRQRETVGGGAGTAGSSQ